MDKTPRTGDLYRRYTNEIYQIAAVATHVQTGERLVVYQAMQGDFGIYAAPLSQFVSDGMQGSQRCQFERIERERQKEKEAAPAVKPEQKPRTQSPVSAGRGLRQNMEEIPETEVDFFKRRRRQIEEREQRRGQFIRPKAHVSATDELQANPNLLRFLDADTYEEKYQVLNEIQDEMTDRLIDDIAVVLDVVIPEGDVDARFCQLKNIILTRKKYETNRFR